MALTIFPSDLPTIDKNAQNSADPTTAVQDDGYEVSLSLPSSEFNFLFNRTLDGLLALFQKPVKDWTPATFFESGEQVKDPATGKLYTSNTGHTSTGATLTENDLVNWDIFSGNIDDELGPFVDGEMVVGDTPTGKLKKSTIDEEVASRIKTDPGIVNGNLDIWQEDPPQLPISNGSFLADLFQYTKNGPQVHNIIRGVGVPNASNPEFPSEFSIDMTVATINDGLDSAENTVITYRMEGYDLAKYFDKTFTFAFWVIGNNTGTYSVAFTNAASNRSFVAQYTINSVNTWELKTIPLTHDSEGTWNIDSSTGMQIKFVFAAGSSFNASAADVWEDGDHLVIASQTNFDAILNNNIKIAQFNHNHGSVFRANLRTPNEEVIRVRRYFNRWRNNEIAFRKHDNSDEMRFSFPFPVEMRATPSVSYSVNAKAGGISDPQTVGVNSTNLNIQFVATNASDENVIVNFETFISSRL